jgi:hypothetical protein
MAGTSTPIFVQVIQTYAVQILNATGTGKVVIATAGANGSLIDMLGVTNTDTLAYTMQLYINDGTTDHLIGTVNIPLSSGNTTAAPTVDLLRQIQLPNLEFDAVGNRCLKLKANYILKAALTGTITAAKTIDIVGSGGDF